MKYFFTFLLSCFLSQNVYLTAQTVVLEKDVEKSFKEKTFGQNRKHFTHFYLGEGLILGAIEDSGNVKPLSSLSFNIGYRYKRRINNYYSVCIDINYNTLKYNLLQDSLKIIPNKVLHKKELVTFYNLGLNIHNRFNFGRRGNHIGKFLDLGIYGDWTFYAKNFFKDKLINAYISRTSISNLDYYNSLNYGASARIGVQQFILFANYRLSDLFVSKFNYPELPRITIGIQFGLHR